MPYGLKRYQQSKQTHFVTFSCYRRLPRLGNSRLRDIFVECLERTRRNYRFRVYGYVAMPEHIHLLVSEPEVELLATAIQALKVAVVRRAVLHRVEENGTLWQKRYYDHNVRTQQSFVEKLRYIHRNPVKRGLVEKPEDWKWSSFRHYALAEIGPVEIESNWTADRRSGKTPKLLWMKQSQQTHICQKQADVGHHYFCLGQMWATSPGTNSASGVWNRSWASLDEHRAEYRAAIDRAAEASAYSTCAEISVVCK